MSLKTLTRSALATVALAGIGIGSANAAFVISEASVEGSWFNTAQTGRGALVDYIPVSGNSGVLFVALYAHDSTGAPTWFTIQGNVVEGQFALTNVPALRATGGTFATASPSVNATQVGTASVTFNSCEDLRVNLTLTTAGLPNLPANQPVELSFSRGGLAGAQCVYRTAFTACPTGTTAVASQPRTCRLSGVNTGNLVLPNSATYVIDGKVQVGQPLAITATTPLPAASTGTITIEPGTLLRGAGGATDFLVINPGSKVFAEGTPTAPIVFTGPTETSGSWGGVLLAGYAQVNSGVAPNIAAAFEADPLIVWGQNNDADSSGVLRYIQIRNAGVVIGSNIELNSLTLGAVGSRTVIDHIQLHNGLDDGIEFFGGTVNARYVVVTRGNDDGLDFDAGGFRGSVQYALVVAGDNADTVDGSCVESDNFNINNGAQPRAVPRVANLTCLARATAPNWRRGMRIRRGSGGNYFNTVIANQVNGEALTVFDQSTYDLFPQAGVLTFSGGYIAGATTNFFDGVSGPTTTVAAWYNGQAGNGTGGAAGVLSGKFPVVGGPLDGTAVNVPAVFEQTSYKGAFGPTPLSDWTQGWTYPGSIP